MSNDYKEGYKEGFRDGFEEALKQVKRFDHPVIPNYPVVPSSWTTKDLTCGICGRKGVHNMVCYDPNCPSRITVTTNTIGAVGSSEPFPLGAKGTNGPAGY